LREIEDMVAEREEIAAGHRDQIADLKAAEKRKFKMLCRELNIDETVAKAMLADRAEDRAYEAKKAKRAAKIPADKIELFVDYLGQFSWLKPEDGDEPAGDLSVAERAARKRSADIANVTEAEQAEGAAVLDELAGEALH